MSARDELLKAFQVVLAAPASPAGVASIEAALGCAVGDDVKAWYAEADGGKAAARGTEFELLSVEGVLRWFDCMWLAESAFGFLPFAENNDSNPICICCKGPLRGFVVQTPHDEEPRLMYRSVDDFFRGALEQFTRDGFFEPYDLSGYIDGSARSDDDRRRVRELLDCASTAADQRDRMLALSFACELLPGSDVAEIYGLIALGDETVRRQVRLRLRRIDSPEAHAALERDLQTFNEFVEQCAELIRAAGISVSLDSDEEKGLCLDEDKTFLNMPSLFPERTSPGFTERLLEIARRKR